MLTFQSKMMKACITQKNKMMKGCGILVPKSSTYIDIQSLLFIISLVIFDVMIPCQI